LFTRLGALPAICEALGLVNIHDRIFSISALYDVPLSLNQYKGILGKKWKVITELVHQECLAYSWPEV